MAFPPRKNGVKPPKGRPPGTSNLSRPPVDDTFPTALSAFSPSGALFALLSLAIDKHRLRVYDTLSGQSTAEHIVDAARVTALTWACFDPSPGQATHSVDASPDKKKRKKRKSTTASADNHAHPIDLVLLGLSDGSVSIFSPPHCKVLRTLYHPFSSASIMSIFVNQSDSGETTIWTSSSDSVMRLWNATKNTVIGSWRSHDKIPYSSIAQRPRTPDQDASRLELLVANHTIRLLSAISSPPEAVDSETQKLQELASFAGHASSITHLQWDVSQRPPRRFLSMAEGDRIVYVWQVPPLQDGSPVEGRIVASIPLDSDARLLSFSYSPSSPSDSVKQHILTLSASGKICVFPVPAELTPQASSNKTHRKVPTLLARSTISVSAKPSSSPIRVVAATFATGQDGQIRVARLVGGIRPIFETLDYLDGSGDFIREVNIVHDDLAVDPNGKIPVGVPTKRYAEPPSLKVGSGVELGRDEEMDEPPLHGIDGDLDVGIAELSLGQRLAAMSGRNAAQGDSDSEEAHSGVRDKRHRLASTVASTLVPATSLTRTLIQALHSSDTRLLETCLAHSDITIIKNTVRRLPPQLAIPLLTACMERLGRGARAGTMKGGGAGASSQRGKGLVGWVKAVLAFHSGHLITLPDLVARLSGLHATLTSRLALQEGLLTLSGRLEVVLSQIEARSSAAPAPLTIQKGKDAANKPKRAANRYIEGESEDEGDPMDVVIEMEDGDEAGSIEDVELGGDSEDGATESSEEEEEDEEEDEDEGDDDDDDSEPEGPRLNGFIDDEAEETEGDEEDDESE